MDALIAELRDGSVTLRRNNRRKTRTNAALQEMFAILEESRTQNRSSKKLVDIDLRLVGNSFLNSNTNTAATLSVPMTKAEGEQETAEDGDTIFV